MTNEERFIASCESVGEVDVRQKLNADRYSGQRAVWASSWLEQVESNKTDATKAEERSSLLLGTKPNSKFASATLAALFVLMLAIVFLLLRYK
jgi:hypothetical protein